MKIKAIVVWTCTLLVSLLVESCHTQKLNVHWGPQSMMYLKGKHCDETPNTDGRRFVSKDDNSVLQGWYAVLRGIQRQQSLETSRPSRMLRSQEVLIHYQQER